MYIYILVVPAWFCFIGIIHSRLADFDLSIVSNIWFGKPSLMLKSNTGCVHVDVIFGIQKQRFFFFFFFFFFLAMVLFKKQQQQQQHYTYKK